MLQTAAHTYIRLTDSKRLNSLLLAQMHTKSDQNQRKISRLFESNVTYTRASTERRRRTARRRTWRQNIYQVYLHTLFIFGFTRIEWWRRKAVSKNKFIAFVPDFSIALKSNVWTPTILCVCPVYTVHSRSFLFLLES